MDYVIKQIKDRTWQIRAVLFTIPVLEYKVSVPLRFAVLNRDISRGYMLYSFIPKYYIMEQAVEAAEFYQEHVDKRHGLHRLESVFLRVQIKEGELTLDKDIIDTSSRVFFVEHRHDTFVGSQTECIEWLDREEKILHKMHF